MEYEKKKQTKTSYKTHKDTKFSFYFNEVSKHFFLYCN